MLNRYEDCWRGYKPLMTVAVLTLLLSGLVSEAARAAQPAQRLTADQRKELESPGGRIV